jgi:DNA repair protein RecO (recombination protein O)
MGAFIKGIRKSRNRIRVDLLFRLRIIFSRKRPPYLINAHDLIDPYFSFYGNIKKTFLGMYFAELINRVSPEEEPHVSVYELLCFALAQLDRGGIAPDTLARIFEIRLMMLFGYQPFLEGCVACHCRIQTAGSFEFDLLKGGLVCRRCRDINEAMLVRITPGSVNFLKQAQRFELEKVRRLHLVQPLQKEVARFLQRYIQVQLDVRMRSYRFLKMVSGIHGS